MASNEHIEDLALKDTLPVPTSLIHRDSIVNSRLAGDADGRSLADAPAEEAGDSDIYRGEHTEPTIPTLGVRYLEEPERSSVASSSSSSSLHVGRRLGDLANVVEAAITRWARLHSSASSITSSSSSSSASSTASGRRRSKARSRMSAATIHSHEQALLERKRAREQSKTIGRGFILLLPSHLVEDAHQKSGRKAGTSSQGSDKRTIRTSSMPIILIQLEAALKKSAKYRRMQDRTGGPKFSSAADKGKSRAIVKESPGASFAFRPSSSSDPLPEKGWWLDVANPTWDDLRNLGKLLRLHPLTLEDILHQDPREKLDLFPGLGYYFIVFRALESEQARERFRQYRSHSHDESAMPDSIEGAIGAVNVYLVVFKEGICSFHFEDISEHTEKLRTRILSLEDTLNMTSDWIAHGLLDSFVDSFFPILTVIEKEVKEIDALVLNGSFGSVANDSKPEKDTGQTASEKGDDASTEKRSSSVFDVPIEKGEDNNKLSSRRCRNPLVFELPVADSPLVRRIRRTMLELPWRLLIKRARSHKEKEEQVVSAASRILLRMAATRRIVTSLGRLLASKGDVIAQIRKRMRTLSPDATSAGLGLGEIDGEIAIYMGDIQDHIVSFQQSLAYYERMLSQSQPAYLSQLRVAQSLAKGGTDKAILILTTVSIIVLCIQVILGLFSVNLGRIPGNNRTGNKYNTFAILLGCTVLIGTGVISLVRYWRHRAKKKYSRRSKI